MTTRPCRLFHVDAFTRTRFGGNPADVVLDADSLTDEQMQLIARESGYATLRLHSGEMRKVPAECRATVGEVGNVEHNLALVERQRHFPEHGDPEKRLRNVVHLQQMRHRRRPT